MSCSLHFMFFFQQVFFRSLGSCSLMHLMHSSSCLCILKLPVFKIGGLNWPLFNMLWFNSLCTHRNYEITAHHFESDSFWFKASFCMYLRRVPLYYILEEGNKETRRHSLCSYRAKIRTRKSLSQKRGSPSKMISGIVFQE